MMCSGHTWKDSDAPWNVYLRVLGLCLERSHLATCKHASSIIVLQCARQAQNLTCASETLAASAQGYKATFDQAEQAALRTAIAAEQGLPVLDDFMDQEPDSLCRCCRCSQSAVPVVTPFCCCNHVELPHVG